MGREGIEKMKAMYKVEAIKPRKIKGADGYFTAADGYVESRSFQEASSEEEAISIAKMYHGDHRGAKWRATVA